MNRARLQSFFSMSVWGVLAPACLMLLCWLPYLVAYAPGTMGWDTTFQISQCYPDHGPILAIPWAKTESYVACQFSDHHPLFDTLIFGLFAYTSDLLTGSWNAGLTLYIALQACAMSVSLSLLLAYLSRLGCSHRFCAGALAFFCLFPVFPVNAATVIKDTLFCWLFVLYFLMVGEIVRTNGKAATSARFVAGLLLLSVLVSLTKKLGMYMVVPMSLFLCVLYRKQWIALLMPACAVLVTMLVVLPRVVFPALDVIPGGRQESLGPAFQQTARYVIEHEDDISATEHDAIDAVLDYDALPDVYNPDFVDPVKFTYRWQSATSDDVNRYLRTWMDEGLRDPLTYLSATWNVIDSYFDPHKAIDLYRSSGKEADGSAKASFYEQTAPLRSLLNDLYDHASTFPVLRILFSDVLYAWILPLGSCAIVLSHRTSRRRFGPLYVLVGLQVGTLLVSPLAMSRYLYQLIYIAPVLVGFARLALKDR